MSIFKNSRPIKQAVVKVGVPIAIFSSFLLSQGCDKFGEKYGYQAGRDERLAKTREQESLNKKKEDRIMKALYGRLLRSTEVSLRSLVKPYALSEKESLVETLGRIDSMRSAAIENHYKIHLGRQKIESKIAELDLIADALRSSIYVVETGAKLSESNSSTNSEGSSHSGVMGLVAIGPLIVPHASYSPNKHFESSNTNTNGKEITYVASSPILRKIGELQYKFYKLQLELNKLNAKARPIEKFLNYTNEIDSILIKTIREYFKYVKPDQVQSEGGKETFTWDNKLVSLYNEMKKCEQKWIESEQLDKLISDSKR